MHYRRRVLLYRVQQWNLCITSNPELRRTILQKRVRGSFLNNMSSSVSTKPDYVGALESAYGAPSQAGFGSAVFFERTASDLVKTARAKYKFFVGDNWERFGEVTWLRQWKLVYARPVNAKHDILSELRAISDAQAKLSVPMILEAVENASKAREALSAAFDDASVLHLAAFNIGDGEAMSGILIAGERENGETTCLVFLLD